MRQLERIGIGNFPTPFEKMPRLSEELEGPKIYVKRDDLTGLAMGGNKTRQLDYILVEARKMNANAIITTCGVQSNWARQVTAAAAKLRMKPLLVLRTAQFKGRPRVLDGNILLDHIMGAEVKVVKMKINEDPQSYLEEEAEKLRKKGYRPYILSLQKANSPEAAVAYIDCMREIQAQAKEEGIEIDSVFVACGAGPTQAGLALGSKVLGMKTRVIGVNVGAYSKRELTDIILNCSAGASNLLDVSSKLSERDVEILDGYQGKGYGIPTKDSINAILKVARLEGILLDPVYTSKAMGALIDLVRKGRFRKDENICFLHTGGVPALFAYKQYFQP